MKNKVKILLIGCIATVFLLPVSCIDNLLNQQSTADLDAGAFWKSEDDALYALHGAYASVRPCFDRDYFLDGYGEYVRTRGQGTPASYPSGEYSPSSGFGGSFDNMYRDLFGGVHRANYVIDNVSNMITAETLEARRNSLERIIGEARMLRGMCYFKLITMWGDVPGIWQTVNDNSEVASISRTSMAVIKDSIYNDFSYAFDKLPNRVTAEPGRPGKAAARALRGKLQLYWACWNNFGWPELEGFSANATEAKAAYSAAAADFLDVINNTAYGSSGPLQLFRNGEPGDCDVLGRADILPNYYHLFIPKTANYDEEFILTFTHGGTGVGQSEELVRDFSGRSHGNSQVWMSPRFEIADRYQSTITGDFCPPLVMMNSGDRVTDFTTVNSALNPQSYADRDYRMKATMMWDYETSMGLDVTGANTTNWVPFIYDTWAVTLTAADVAAFPGLTDWHIGQRTYETDGTNSGYLFRKYVRNYGGQNRSEGDFNWPVIRLADVYLMYAEAINEANNGPDAKAIELVNKVRHRGNLPPLAAAKTASKEEFFKAIEQERIIELVAEGHRLFDLRRWRAIERAWCLPRDPNGVWRRDTRGINRSRFFQDAIEQVYQRIYIFRIPPGERERNPNLSQNKCWL